MRKTIHNIQDKKLTDIRWKSENIGKIKKIYKMHRNTTQYGVKEEEEESVRLNKIKKEKNMQ